ncbi:MAG: alpha/beta fold hydrolase [Gemmatimonadetes bacterium]|nr:alpha/beta fold hydrolase [Gemmatimonadota bacterium]
MHSRSRALAFGLLAAAVAAVGAARPLAAQPAARAPMRSQDALVVLVHGMGRTSMSMWPMQRALEADGYRVLNFFYSSYGPTIAEIGAELSRAVDAEVAAQPVARVHFVGHSLGNIVVRWMLANDPMRAPLGRMVMLAPPNRGAHVADAFAPYVSWLLAPITELTTTGSTVASLPAPPKGLEFAIVAGRDDRTVSFDETCLAGARAHIIVPQGHTFIMMRDDTIEIVKRFLDTGTIPPAQVATGRCPARVRTPS